MVTFNFITPIFNFYNVSWTTTTRQQMQGLLYHYSIVIFERPCITSSSAYVQNPWMCFKAEPDIFVTECKLQIQIQTKQKVVFFALKIQILLTELTLKRTDILLYNGFELYYSKNFDATCSQFHQHFFGRFFGTKFWHQVNVTSKKLPKRRSYEKFVRIKLMKLTPVVNFISILCMNFLYERCFGSFSLVTCT
jgi:hypothetical protein